MSPFYRKPKPETMRANRENYKRVYKHEIKWLKENVGKLTQYKHKFLYTFIYKNNFLFNFNYTYNFWLIP